MNVVRILENFMYIRDETFDDGKCSRRSFSKTIKSVCSIGMKYHAIAGEMFNVSQTNPQDVRTIVDFLGLFRSVERVESL